MVRIIPMSIEISINVFILLVKYFAIATGIVSRAITRMIPTTRIITTTLKATRHRSSKYIFFVGIPTTVENSSSNEIAENSLKNESTTITITTSRRAIVIRSEVGTVRIFPKR